MISLKPIILSMLPISELRGGIPLALFLKYTPLQAFLFCTLANIIIIPFIFLFLDTIHRSLLKLKFYNNMFNKHIENKRTKIEKYIGTKWELLVLFIFVAIPAPLTGGWTGSILAWFFKLNKLKSIIAISLGVATAGVIVILASLGFLSLF